MVPDSGSFFRQTIRRLQDGSWTQPGSWTDFEYNFYEHNSLVQPEGRMSSAWWPQDSFCAICGWCVPVDFIKVWSLALTTVHSQVQVRFCFKWRSWNRFLQHCKLCDCCSEEGAEIQSKALFTSWPTELLGSPHMVQWVSFCWSLHSNNQTNK